MKNKKFKTILHVFDEFRVGGTESRTCQVINHTSRIYHHIICSQKKSFAAKRLFSKDANVSFLWVRSDPKNVIGNILRFRSTLCKLKPDLLISYAWGAMEWAIANSVKKICPNIHALEGFGDDEISKQKFRRKIIRMIFLRTCTRVVTCSDVLKNFALHSWKVPHAKVFFIANGIDLDYFFYDRKSKLKLDLKFELVTLSIIATLSPLKNHLRLLRALECMPKEIAFRLIVAGDGLEMGNLKNYVAESKTLRDRVEFRGHCQEPWEVLKESEIFCLSSDTEQMPMVVLEAMASGLPVISTDVGDVKKIVSIENQPFVVEKDNVERYVRKMEELILNRNLRIEIGNANQKKCCKYFTKSKMIKNYEQLYENTIG